MSFILSWIALICLMVTISTVFKDVGVGVLFNFDAFIIVTGGTVTALFIGFPLKRIKAAIYDIIGTFRSGSSREDIAREIVEIARLNRSTDIKKLEARAVTTSDTLLKLGINLLANRYENKEIRNIMEREMANRIVNLNLSQNVLMTLARLTPSFGLAGTVIGLIKIFRHFESVDTVIPTMAVALMSTFYGVFLSNLILLPLSAKIKESAILCEEQMQMTIEGIVEVSKGEHPLRIEEKLLGYSDIASDMYAVESLNEIAIVKSSN